MKDLTQHSILGHIVTMATPVAVSMLAQLAYQMVDLYFITRLGAAATAGVNAAGNAAFIVGALTQMLGVGTTTLIAQAVGRQARAHANVIFNQSLALAVACGLGTIAVLSALSGRYVNSVASDAPTVTAGLEFLRWMLPGFALMFPMAAVSAALRGTGSIRAPIYISMITVVINAALAPMLIAGWGTGVALGVRGAGLATSLSILAGNLLLALYLYRSERYLRIDRELLRPPFDHWRCLLSVGLPVSGELLLMFLSTTVVYYAIRDFGAAAQAGFGIGSRLLQVILLPGMAIAFAVGPIVGQNIGAKNAARVRETFYTGALLASALMIAPTVIAQAQPHLLLTAFDTDPSATAAAISFLQTMSWTFIVQAFVYTCSTMFQGLGNTMPSLVSVAARFLAFTGALGWQWGSPGFRIEHVWYVLIASVAVQALVSVTLLTLELRRRLTAIA